MGVGCKNSVTVASVVAETALVAYSANDGDLAKGEGNGHDTRRDRATEGPKMSRSEASRARARFVNIKIFLLSCSPLTLLKRLVRDKKDLTCMRAGPHTRGHLFFLLRLPLLSASEVIHAGS
ncbi:hypothetical protein LCGC14_0259420 [marine sediment metagenome]|uniref:Uncharacterized protein n=1 Tax=marine sediment metagenome TaxID=412755 RepID=A0A0F9UJE5_9ZZZZ